MLFLLVVVLSSITADSQMLSGYSPNDLKMDSYSELLLNFVQLNLDDQESLNSKLKTLLAQVTQNSQSKKESSMCDSQMEKYKEILEDTKEKSKSFQKEIDSLLALLEDAKTYVPEKEQEAEQAKRWSETALMEIDLEKTRFLEKDSNYQKNIEACTKALALISNTQGLSLIQGAKISQELLMISQDGLNAAVQSLISIASKNSSEDVEKIKNLFNELKTDLEESREINKKNHEDALRGAQAYSEEKYYTYYNLNRQLNIILDNQVKLQQELYHKQLEVEMQNDKAASVNRKMEMLENICRLEKEKNKYEAAEYKDSIKSIESFMQLVDEDGFLLNLGE